MQVQLRIDEQVDDDDIQQTGCHCTQEQGNIPFLAGRSVPELNAVTVHLVIQAQPVNQALQSGNQYICRQKAARWVHQIANNITGKSSNQTHARAKQHTNYSDCQKCKVQLCKLQVNGKCLDNHRDCDEQCCDDQAPQLGEFLCGLRKTRENAFHEKIPP